MTIHDEILRLRDLVRRVADELKIDTARKIADEELARPMPQWQGLTYDEILGIVDVWTLFTQMDARDLVRMAEQRLIEKNGGTR